MNVLFVPKDATLNKIFVRGLKMTGYIRKASLLWPNGLSKEIRNGGTHVNVLIVWPGLHTFRNPNLGQRTGAKENGFILKLFDLIKNLTCNVFFLHRPVIDQLGINDESVLDFVTRVCLWANVDKPKLACQRFPELLVGIHKDIRVCLALYVKLGIKDMSFGIAIP